MNGETNTRAVDAFLRTDPLDVGCAQAMEILHVYAELVGEDPESARRLYPGVAAHLRACRPCAEDLAGLLAAVADDGAGFSGRPH